MEYYLKLKQRFLWIPIVKKQPRELLEIWADGEKKLEFMVPSKPDGDLDYVFDFYAPVRCEELLEMELMITGEFSEGFFSQIRQSEGMPAAYQEQSGIHLRPGTGWLNDPNGLVYRDGVYHMYFQYNPFDTEWENMSWGHSVSRDLLHWERRPDVLYPDQDGMMFSGCGLVNDRGCLGLPEYALLFFYSVAGGANPWSKGKDFVQKLAYSVDGGETLHKMEGWEMPAVCRENRDPKIFWHGESGHFVMALWLEGNDFGIFLSKDLKEFTMSQRFTLEEAWECPDLFKLIIEGSHEYRWIFWSADGFYYIGDFDGESFRSDNVRLEAYGNKLPYAAQTYAGVSDRVISVPWLRTRNQDKNYHGMMGLPREMTIRRTETGFRLVQKIVREWDLSKKEICRKDGCIRASFCKEEKGAAEVTCHPSKGGNGKISGLTLDIMGMSIRYQQEEKRLSAGEDTIQLMEELTDLSLVSDGEIIEITGNSGIIVAMFERPEAGRGMITVECEGPVDIRIYESQGEANWQR